MYVYRIVMVFMPQSGYIHPDEFFQSVEVVTGDVLGTDTVRTWEFNVTAPIRYNATYKQRILRLLLIFKCGKQVLPQRN